MPQFQMTSCSGACLSVLRNFPHQALISVRPAIGWIVLVVQSVFGNVLRRVPFLGHVKKFIFLNHDVVAERLLVAPNCQHSPMRLAAAVLLKPAPMERQTLFEGCQVGQHLFDRGISLPCPVVRTGHAQSPLANRIVQCWHAMLGSRPCVVQCGDDIWFWRCLQRSQIA